MLPNYCIIFLAFQADPPDCSKIPREDAVGVTVVLLTCSFKNQEFIRVGYYVNNEYSEPEMKENPPLEPDYTKVFDMLLCFIVCDFQWNRLMFHTCKCINHY